MDPARVESAARLEATVRSAGSDSPPRPPTSIQTTFLRSIATRPHSRRGRHWPPVARQRLLGSDTPGLSTGRQVLRDRVRAHVIKVQAALQKLPRSWAPNNPPRLELQQSASFLPGPPSPRRAARAQTKPSAAGRGRFRAQDHRPVAAAPVQVCCHAEVAQCPHPALTRTSPRHTRSPPGHSRPARCSIPRSSPAPRPGLGNWALAPSGSVPVCRGRPAACLPAEGGEGAP